VALLAVVMVTATAALSKLWEKVQQIFWRD